METIHRRVYIQGNPETPNVSSANVKQQTERLRLDEATDIQDPTNHTLPMDIPKYLAT